MNYENKIKKHRRQATIVNGQYQNLNLANNNQLIYPETPVTIIRGKRAEQMLLEQKEQCCENLRWTVQQMMKELSFLKGANKSNTITKIKEMMEEIKNLENEIGGSGYAYLIQQS